ncbi:MAG: flagellar hook-associated protein FlgK, partial [Oscillospiraceae bacterium]|nr:flagellar hook-associated protein FlgK [Oscillospiraceae bacterium]
QSKRVNEIGSQIAALNESILKFELSGNSANDLRDKRNLLLDELSGLVNITYQDVPTGKVDINGAPLSTLNVTIGGAAFVTDNQYRAIEAVQDKTNDVLDAFPVQPVAPDDLLHSIRFVDDASEVNLSGGAMKAYLDIRDGNTVDTQGIPYFKAQLDKLVKGLVESFNAVHETGYTMPYTDDFGVFHPSVTGIPFFDPDGLTLDTFDLSSYIKENPAYLAPAHKKVEIDPVTGDYETGNNEVALALVKLQQRSDIPVIGGFEKYYNTFLTELASETSHALRTSEQEYALLDGLEAQRMSVSGVSLDEEMTNLIRFQQAYNAAARVITAMDEALDVLINRTGRVGL